jgi:hypothetical protein
MASYALRLGYNLAGLVRQVIDAAAVWSGQDLNDAIATRTKRHGWLAVIIE